MYFSHAFRKTLLAAPTTAGGSTLLAATSGATSALTAGQLGIYDQNFSVIDYTGAGGKTPFYIVQGSYYKTSGYSDKIGAHGGYQESVKSKMINPKYISRIFWVQAKAPVQQVVQIPLTAQSGSTNVGLNAETTYRLRIDVKGSPALRFLSHNIYRVLDSYTGPANVTNPTYLKDPVATLVDWKEQLTMSPYFNQLVQARAYALRTTDSSTGVSALWSTVNSVAYAPTTYTNILPGQRVINATTAANLPANSFVFSKQNAASTTATHSATGVTITTSTYTATSGGTSFGAATGVGAIITGASFPSGSYISSYTSQSAFTITFPTQTTPPTISGSITASPGVILQFPTQSTAPAVANFSSVSFKYYNDLYGANGGYTIPYTNIAATSGQMPTYQGQTPYIPGSSAYNTSGPSQTSGIATLPTGTTIAAASTVSSATVGAHIYTPASDNSTFTTDAFLELTAAYMETKFGNPTFTVTDNYDLEPLKIIASLMDDSGNPVVTAPIGTAAVQTIGEAGIATVTQASSMAQGTGETVLRELILTGKYRQEAFGDGSHIDQFRMREIEANPGVLNMMTIANRNGLYNKLCILHSVPRFNNPTGVFDNDQYLIEIALPNTLSIDKIFTSAATYPGGSTATYTAGGTIAGSGSGSGLGDYILESSYAAGGAQYAEMI